MGNVVFVDAGRTEERSSEKLPCSEGCVRCCTDRGNPLELTAGEGFWISHVIKSVEEESVC